MQLEWQEKARSLAFQIGRSLALQAGPSAFTGRAVKKKGKKEEEFYYSAPKAFNVFYFRLNTIYKKEGYSGKE